MALLAKLHSRRDLQGYVYRGEVHTFRIPVKRVILLFRLELPNVQVGTFITSSTGFGNLITTLCYAIQVGTLMTSIMQFCKL